MAVKTYPWDLADYVDDYEDVDYLIEIALEDYDPRHTENVLNDIARSKAMAKLAAKWATPDDRIVAYIHERAPNALNGYASQPALAVELASAMEIAGSGGYDNLQLFKLVRNSADALSRSNGGQIWIRLTPTHLYCADDGEPIDVAAVRALMFAHQSHKRGAVNNGRIRLGLKFAHGVAHAPGFFSRSGSFRLDRAGSAKEISKVAPDAARHPSLRLPEAIHPIREAALDPVLRDLMEWATNIVRLPLDPANQDALAKQISDFPADFPPLAKRVGQVVLQTDEMETPRVIPLDRKEEDERALDSAGVLK